MSMLLFGAEGISPICRRLRPSMSRSLPVLLLGGGKVTADLEWLTDGAGSVVVRLQPSPSAERKAVRGVITLVPEPHVASEAKEAGASLLRDHDIVLKF
jgi:hypothetical protein